MSMFEKYEDASYTAYNLTPPTVYKQESLLLNPPYIKYDNRRNPQQIIWDPKDSFTFGITFGMSITVFEDDLIFSVSGQHPNENTEGRKGLKAYNTVDGKSWTCKGTVKESFSQDEWIPIMGGSSTIEPEWEGIVVTTLPQRSRHLFNSFDDREDQTSTPDLWVWEEDKKLNFPKNGNKVISINTYDINTEFKCTIFNFRREEIYSYKSIGVPPVINISTKDTPLMVEGQYFIDMVVCNGASSTQRHEVPVTIVSNPVKYIQDDIQYPYKSTYTTQVQKETTFTWESLNTVNDEYVWIPIN